MPEKFELLAPAGNFPSMIAAVEAGADAVYFGLGEFNMRDSARNFRISDLARIEKICNAGKKKVRKYMTLNTIIYDSEIPKIERIIQKIKGKIEAVICWDLSVIGLCRKYRIPVHISTQASVSNIESAKFYKKLGAERVILARELNLKQIKKIARIIPVETFIHGAMCVSVSGRCFTSQFLHNRSANRGQCTHPCRKAYIVKDEEGNELKLENSCVMSAKDLCTLPFLEELKKAGITAFKIEGRNRGAEYVSLVTQVYRKALDRKLTCEEIKKSLSELEKVYNRDFSSGFYLGVPTPDDFFYKEDGLALERKEILGKVVKYWKKIGVAHVKILANSAKLGDEVYVIGKETGVKRAKVESMEMNHKQVKSCKKGDDVGIKLPGCKKGDDVYIIKRNKCPGL